MPRSVAEIKNDIDKKFREINSVRKKIEAAQTKLDKDRTNMTTWGIGEAEHKIDSLQREMRRIEKEKDKIELEAYGTWVPLARAAREADQLRLAERDRKTEERILGENARRNAKDAGGRRHRKKKIVDDQETTEEGFESV